MTETTYTIKGVPPLALLTDLHNHPYAAVIDSLRCHRPSLILIAGDVIYGKWPEGNESPLTLQTNVLPFLSACADLAPSFLSLGNHEQMLDSADLEEIGKTGVTVLDNSWARITIRERDIVIGGLTSAYATDYRKAVKEHGSEELRYPRRESITGLEGITTAAKHVPETEWLSAFCSVPGSYRILLSHHPEYFPLVPEEVDLVLSGHAHGGQWRFFGHGVFAPGQGFWPRWTHGVYNGNRLVVSAGLSNTARIPRLFNPPEIVYLESP